MSNQADLGDEIDPILDSLNAQHAALARKAALWLEAKTRLLPLVKDLILLGCDVNMHDQDLNCTFSGDKQQFLRVEQPPMNELRTLPLSSILL